MAVAFGVGAVSAAGYDEGASFTHAAIASGDWALIYFLADEGSVSGDFSSPLFGGVAGTYVGRVTADTGVETGVYEQFLYRFAGAIAANSTFTITGPIIAFKVGLCSVTGADATTPFGTPAGGGDDDGGVGTSITVPSDGLAVSFGFGIDSPGPNLGWTNATERAEGTALSIYTTGVATGTSGTPSVSFTPAALAGIAIIAVPVSPAAAAAGHPTIKRFGGVYGARGPGQFGRGSGVW